MAERAAFTAVHVTCVRCSGDIEIPVTVRKTDRHEIGQAHPTSAYFTVVPSRVEHICDGVPIVVFDDED